MYACVLRLDTDQGTFYTVHFGHPPEQAQTIRNNYRQHFPDNLFSPHSWSSGLSINLNRMAQKAVRNLA
jgi:hypothetical protein